MHHFPVFKYCHRHAHFIRYTPQRSSTQKNALYLSISNGNIIYNNTCITSVPGMKKSLLLCFAAGCYTACRRFTFLLCDTTEKKNRYLVSTSLILNKKIGSPCAEDSV